MLTSLQYSILKALGKKEKSGNDIRQKINLTKSLPTFYQLMKRLENKGLVEGRYEKQMYGKQLIIVRYYKVTEKGLREFKETKELYQ